MDNLQRDFGDIVKKKLIDLKLRKNEFSKLINITASHLSQMLSGDKTMDFHYVLKILKHLDTQICISGTAIKELPKDFDFVKSIDAVILIEECFGKLMEYKKLSTKRISNVIKKNK